MSDPFLMIPPPINKHYVGDLAPGRSFVEWAVAQAVQSFLLGGDSRFVLTSTGHIQTIVNPPGKPEPVTTLAQRVRQPPKHGFRPQQSTRGRGGQTVFASN